MVTNIENPVHHRFARIQENIAIKSERVAEDPKESNPRCSQKLGLSYDTLWLILYLDIHTHSYKVQLMQQMKPADHSQCRRYVKWLLEQQAVDANFSYKLFSARKHISHSMGM